MICVTKAALFDLDGTLVDMFEGYFQAFKEALKSNNLPEMSREDLGKYYGQIDTEIFRQFLNLPKVNDVVLGVAKQKQKILVDDGAKYITALPGASELIDTLAQHKVPMAIASSARASAIALAMKSIGIAGKINVIVSADDVTLGKPHPEIFLKAAEKLGIPPKNCIVFEDSIHGVLAAKAAGMKCIAVTTGKTPREELEKLKPYMVVDSLKEILPKMDEVLKK